MLHQRLNKLCAALCKMLCDRY